MRVRMSTLARADFLAAVTWWKRNLGETPVHLVAELKAARTQLATSPYSGVAVADEVVSTLRRLTLLRSRYLIFYKVDEARSEVSVLRVWHMSRGRSPKL